MNELTKRQELLLGTFLAMKEHKMFPMNINALHFYLFLGTIPSILEENPYCLTTAYDVHISIQAFLEFIGPDIHQLEKMGYITVEHLNASQLSYIKDVRNHE